MSRFTCFRLDFAGNLLSTRKCNRKCAFIFDLRSKNIQYFSERSSNFSACSFNHVFLNFSPSSRLNFSCVHLVCINVCVQILDGTMVKESTFTIKSVDEIKPIFRDSDNTQNIFLVSNIPWSCKTEPCILGIDEAGRGPVLGPMNYGICFCPKSKEEVLKTIGCADSKSLTDEKRQVILGKICEETETLGWMVEAISPNNICRSMFRRQKYSLNQVSHDSAIGLIKKAQASGVNVCEVFVDTVGPPEKYQDKLSYLFPELKVTVSKKADALFPIVSAASICAKVTRDFAIEVWNFNEEVSTEKKYGSGYPNDPETKKFLKTNIDPIFGFPKLVRFSWSTAEKILVESATPVKWEEEEEKDDGKPAKNHSITSFFTGSSKAKRARHSFFQQSNLSITDCFRL